MAHALMPLRSTAQIENRILIRTQNAFESPGILCELLQLVGALAHGLRHLVELESHQNICLPRLPLEDRQFVRISFFFVPLHDLRDFVVSLSRGDILGLLHFSFLLFST